MATPIPSPARPAAGGPDDGPAVENRVERLRSAAGPALSLLLHGLVLGAFAWLAATPAIPPSTAATSTAPTMPLMVSLAAPAPALPAVPSPVPHPVAAARPVAIPEPPRPKPALRRPVAQRAPAPPRPRPALPPATASAGMASPARTAPEAAAAPEATSPGPIAAAPLAATPATFAGPGLNNPHPRYPYLARQRGLQGRVRLKVMVDPQGLVRGIEVKASSGSLLLDRAALAAVAKWRFRPATRNGIPVAAEVLVPVDFRLR